MDSFDQIILASLKDGSPRSFKEILAKGGLSHNTLKRHLRRLMDRGLVLRAKKVKNRRGRPEYSYCLTPKLRQRVNLTLTEPYMSLVTLTFTKLSQICKHSKGGFCKARKGNCTSYVCPNVIRDE